METKNTNVDSPSSSKIITMSLEDTIKTQVPYSTLGSTPNNTDQTVVTDCSYLTDNNLKARIDYAIINFEVDNINEFNFVKSSILAWFQCNGIATSRSKPQLGQTKSFNHFSDGQLLVESSHHGRICGAIKWNTQKSIFRLELSGRACNRINTHDDYFFIIQDLAKHHKIVIRRLDIAVDDFTGKYGIRFVQQAASKGLYNGKTGDGPTYTTIKKGNERTIRIGSNKSFLSMCIYEKGKQMGLPVDHPDYLKRVRHELRMNGTKEHPIPVDALFFPDKYFVGAYPRVHRRIIKNTEPRCIKREVVEETDISLDKKLKYAKRQIGPSVFLAQQRLTDSEIVNVMSRQRVNNQSTYPDFITASDLALLPYKYIE